MKKILQNIKFPSATESVLVVSAVALFCCVNILGYSWGRDIGFDATENRRFTVSEQSIKLVRKMDDIIHIKLYASDLISTDFPSFKNYVEHVKDYLNKLSQKSRGKLVFEFIRVGSFSPVEDEIVASGLTGLPLKDGRSVFFGIVAENMLDGSGVLPFLSPEREGFLEYDIARLIDGLSNLKKMSVALSSSLPLSVGSAGANVLTTGQVKPFLIYNELKARYDILYLSKDYKELLHENAPDVALILHPRPLTPEAEKNLMTYLAKGGRVIAALDPFSEYPPPAPNMYGDVPVSSSGLGGLLKRYGIDYNPDLVILDKGIAQRGRDPNSGRSQDLLAWLRPIRNNMDVKDPALSNIKTLSLGTAGYFAQDKNYKGNLTFTPLVTTSPEADTVSTKTLSGDVDMKKITDNYLARKTFNLIAKVTGYFPDNMQKDSNKNAAQGVLVLIADSDFLDDRFWINSTSATGQFTQAQKMGVPFADNASFLLNMVDYLGGDDMLIHLRGRNVIERPLTYLENIKHHAEENFFKREQQLNNDIIALREKLNLARQSENTLTGTALPADVNAKIADFTTRLVQMRTELRDVKRHMNEELRSAELMIKILNILVMPLVIGIFPALWLFVRRYRHMSVPKKEDKGALE